MESTKGNALRHRQASGLVREGKPVDAAFFNFFGATVGPVVAWVLLFGVGFYPGSNIVLTVLLTFLFGLGNLLVYTFFASAMPRSGGDYVFISRTFGPWIGFAASLSFMIWLTFYLGTAGALFGQFGLGPFFRVLAEATGNLSLTSVGDWFVTDWGKFLSGLAMIALTAPILLLGRRGLRTYFRFQRWVFIFCGITLALAIVVMLASSHESFVASFNSYAETFSGVGGAYETVVAAGGGHGSFSLGQTLLAATWSFYGVAFLLGSTYWAGESRAGLGPQMRGIMVPFFVTLGVLLVAAAAGLKTFNADFLTGLALGDPTEYGMTSAPFFTELVAAQAGPVIGLLVTFGLGAWFITYVPYIAIVATRAAIAWSADGIVPQWIGRVDPVRNTPINATLAYFGIAIVFLILYSFTETFSIITATFAFAIVFLITCTAAIFFPYIRSEIYRNSPADRSLFGLPAMSIAGVLGVLGMLAMIVILLRDPSSGTSLEHNKGQLIGIVAVFAAGVLIYLISAAVRRRRGLFSQAAYQELPPE